MRRKLVYNRCGVSSCECWMVFVTKYSFWRPCDVFYIRNLFKKTPKRLNKYLCPQHTFSILLYNVHNLLQLIFIGNWCILFDYNSFSEYILLYCTVFGLYTWHVPLTHTHKYYNIQKINIISILSTYLQEYAHFTCLLQSGVMFCAIHVRNPIIITTTVCARALRSL